VLAVVDTLARCFVGGEENSARDMGRFVAAADRLRTATGAAALLLHHVSRHGGAIRGSTALPGALDTGIAVEAGTERFATERC
jgi:RecA-family ATPase